ncbi:MAG: hypothetical protein K0B81_04835 [Candidatus Cloacimonetes bacterium]|nr:hypothetical protein [Candidatus Cloacimonadota bacterium]
MRKRIIFVFIFSFILLNLFSYSIHQVSISFIDPDRNNRQIPTQVFIPVDIESNRQSEQEFPFIVFGHGFLQSYTVYQSVWQAIVPLGWIMAFPTTEGGFSPSHQNFALDIAFLSFAILEASEDPASPLYNKVKPISVAMGHSMGGGASVLAASGTHDFSALATFAAADTNPSAINAALNVNVPSLTFSGTADWVTPPSSHQIPIYNNLASIYKSFISLNGVGHAGIYSNNIALTLLAEWLYFIESKEIAYLVSFEDLLDGFFNNGNITYAIENYYPPENIAISIENEVLTISWDKALGADHYIVEATDDINGVFNNISSDQGNFTEIDEIVFWSFPIDYSESRLFFRVKTMRSTLNNTNIQ